MEHIDFACISDVTSVVLATGGRLAHLYIVLYKASFPSTTSLFVIPGFELNCSQVTVSVSISLIKFETIYSCVEEAFVEFDLYKQNVYDEYHVINNFRISMSNLITNGLSV